MPKKRTPLEITEHDKEELEKGIKELRKHARYPEDSDSGNMILKEDYGKIS
jgi:hypothetical protein